jgi:ribonucleoside-triphosphate reductase
LVYKKGCCKFATLHFLTKKTQINMDLGLDALSKITIFSKYAKYIPELKRRETWDEIVDRYEAMMTKKYPNLEKEIKDSATFIRKKKVLPSMRALQFAGAAAEVNNSRIYNCCFLPIDSVHSLSLIHI